MRADADITIKLKLFMFIYFTIGFLSLFFLLLILFCFEDVSRRLIADFEDFLELVCIDRDIDFMLVHLHVNKDDFISPIQDIE